MKNAVIVAAVRTPIGSFGGSLKDIGTAKLGEIAIKEAVRKADIDLTRLDEVYMGCIIQAGLGQNVARQCALNAGISVETPCYTVNMVCGSGLKAVVLAAQAIMSGECSAYIAGGTENMSQAPYVLRNMRWGARMGKAEAEDAMISDALTDAISGFHMGRNAEIIARKYNISRDEQDEFALQSQLKAEAAQKKGLFEDELIPVEIPQKKGDSIKFAKDECIRYSSSKEALQKLKPAFEMEGTVTAGNSSVISDGAAALVLMEEEYAQKNGFKPLAKIKSFASAGVEPSLMSIGPVPATQKALDKAGLNLNSIGLIELNEAFASQSIAVIRDLNLDVKKINVNGGAIALGHPVGASGARILVSLVHEMRRRNIRYGLASLCVGGGMGISMIIENPV